MDEAGYSDHTDSREVRVIALIDDPDPSIPVPHDRHSKRSTFVACLSADRLQVKRFAIVPRFTTEKELRYYGYDESNVALTSQSNAFMTRALFELWAKMIFFPTIDHRRRDLGYQGKALFLLDGLESHHTEQLLAECAARNSKVLFLISPQCRSLHPYGIDSSGTR
jgi:hypothetical protein